MVGERTVFVIVFLTFQYLGSSPRQERSLETVQGEQGGKPSYNDGN